MRINKYVAHQGWASRREADTLIAEGKILINGTPAEIGAQVGASDTVELAGKTKTKHYIVYYKGRGIITHSPAPHETDIVTKLQSDYGLSGLSPIGRLDKDSEGLIILSDDGRLTAPLTDPEANIEKEYEVVVDKDITGSFLKHVAAGVDIEGYLTKPATAEQKSNKRFLLTITEGKKHQIRRMCAALGYQVQSLKRIRIASVTLGDMKPNQYRNLKGAELKTLLKQLNIK